jgi:hypothetical protein
MGSDGTTKRFLHSCTNLSTSSEFTIIATIFLLVYAGSNVAFPLPEATFFLLLFCCPFYIIYCHDEIMPSRSSGFTIAASLFISFDFFAWSFRVSHFKLQPHFFLWLIDHEILLVYKYESIMELLLQQLTWYFILIWKYHFRPPKHMVFCSQSLLWPSWW